MQIRPYKKPKKNNIILEMHFLLFIHDKIIKLRVFERKICKKTRVIVQDTTKFAIFAARITVHRYPSELEAININHSKSISYSLLHATRRMQRYIGEAVFTMMSNNTFEEFLQSKKKGSIVISNVRVHVYIQKTKSSYFHKQDDFKRERE